MKKWLVLACGKLRIDERLVKGDLKREIYMRTIETMKGRKAFWNPIKHEVM
jgi:hypothetical protein